MEQHDPHTQTLQIGAELYNEQLSGGSGLSLHTRALPSR